MKPVNLSNLTDKELSMIFEQLPTVELLKIKAVCRQWKFMVEKVLAARTSLHLKNTYRIDSLPEDPLVTIKAIKKCFKKCPNLTSIDLSSFAVPYNSNLRPRWEYQDGNNNDVKVSNFPVIS